MQNLTTAVFNIFAKKSIEPKELLVSKYEWEKNKEDEKIKRLRNVVQLFFKS